MTPLIPQKTHLIERYRIDAPRECITMTARDHPTAPTPTHIA